MRKFASSVFFSDAGANKEDGQGVRVEFGKDWNAERNNSYNELSLQVFVFGNHNEADIGIDIEQSYLSLQNCKEPLHYWHKEWTALHLGLSGGACIALQLKTQLPLVNVLQKEHNVKHENQSQI